MPPQIRPLGEVCAQSAVFSLNPLVTPAGLLAMPRGWGGWHGHCAAYAAIVGTRRNRLCEKLGRTVDAGDPRATVIKRGFAAVQTRPAHCYDPELACGGTAAPRTGYRQPAERQIPRAVRKETAFDRAASALESLDTARIARPRTVSNDGDSVTFPDANTRGQFCKPIDIGELTKRIRAGRPSAL